MEQLSCKNICFIVLIVLNGTLFLNQAWKCFTLFKMDESSMSSNIESTAEAEFPALTICPDYYEAFKKEELLNLKISKKDIRKFNFTNFPSNNLTTYEQYDKVTHNLQDIIEQFTIAVIEPFETGDRKLTRFTYSNDNDEVHDSRDRVEKINEKDWIRQYYQVFGKCYTYEMPEMLRKSEVAYIQVWIKLQSLLYIHHPGQFFWIDSDTKVPILKAETSFLNTQHVVSTL